MKKTIILSAAVLVLGFMTGFAQNSTISPYSQYGLGEIASQSNIAQRGMNGVGIALRDGKQVNFMNPASYSAIDSLTFIFDAGITGRTTNYKEETRSTSGQTGNFDYVMAIFRIVRHLGLSFGLVPYSNMEYNYYIESYTQDLHNDNINTSVLNTFNYSGTGGLREAYLGMGYQPLRNFSVGFNMGYFWGDFTKAVNVQFGDNTTSDTKYYYSTAKSWKLDLGLQYTLPLGKENNVTVGGTYTFGHQICNDAYCSRNADAVASFSMPSSLAVGLAWKKGRQWTAGIDYSLMWFKKLEMPVYNELSSTYTMTPGLMKDRHSFKAGVEFCPSERSRKYYKRIHYRMGVGYTTPYIKVNGVDGPKEFSASIGFGLPIQNGYNNRSILNISGQWVNRNVTGFIRENSFMLSLGLCFNELWFMKWKAE